MDKWLRLSFLALAVLVFGFLTGPWPPLYDGIGFPDEPYKYVNPPDNTKRKLDPSPVTQSVYSSGGTNTYDFTFGTSEQSPQANVYVPVNLLVASKDAKLLTVKLQPLAPDKQPRNGAIAGNVYKFSAYSDKGEVKYTNNAKGTVFLRLPQGLSAGATIIYRPSKDKEWIAEDTTRSGTDIYEAPLSGFGDYAIAKLSNSKPKARKPVLLVILSSSIILMVALLIIRLRLKANK